MNDIKLFESREIRSVLLENEWYFAVVDVMAVLTESKNPRSYWSKLKEREKQQSGVELSTFCQQLKLPATDGKMYKTDCASKQGLLRIIQSVPSRKAEPFKAWLARVGSQYIDEKLNKRLVARRKLQETQDRFLENVKERGVSEKGFISILKKGDQTLFGEQEIHKKYGISDEDNPDDYMNTVLLKGKDFATSLSDMNVSKKDLKGEDEITGQHRSSNKDIRDIFVKQGINPEDLPAEEDIKKIEKRGSLGDGKKLPPSDEQKPEEEQ